MSQAALADLVGRSSSAVRSWERGSSTPTDEIVVHSLAAVLGIDEKTLRTSAGFSPEVPTEDLDTTGDEASAFFVDGTTAGVESEETEAGEVGEAERMDAGRPSVELPASEDQPDQPALARAPLRRATDSKAADEIPVSESVARETNEEGVEPLRGPDRRTGATPGSHQVVTPEPVGPVAGSAAPPTRTIPARQMPATVVEPSYLDDPDQRTTYWVRTALTVAFFVFLLIVLFWAFGRLGDSMGEVSDLFKAAS